jgi:ABC-type transport system involved in multi-copper enzyme maturation permease subunit
MMTQTLAILWDAYRDLQSRKMFWAVIILNVVVVGLFSVIGANDHTITILWLEPLGDIRARGVPPLFIYKYIFSSVIVDYWFTWIAAALALVSTAGIFPEFLASGSVDLFLAKPLSRLRLFFTKYLAGLLFVTLQVALFAVLSFVVLGVRAGLWQPGLFAAIPLVVVFFSYLFGMCVLLGVWTRSTIAALLLTILAWFCIWGVDGGERIIQSMRHDTEMRQAYYDDQIDDIDAQIAQAGTSPDSAAALRSERDTLAQQRKELEISPSLITAENVAYGIKTVVPKTRETVVLLDRVLFSDKELQDISKHDTTTTVEAAPSPSFPPGPPPGRGPPGFRRARAGGHAAAREAEQLAATRTRPVWWIIGTSVLFEAACLALAAWHFCTRDF